MPLILLRPIYALLLILALTSLETQAQTNVPELLKPMPGYQGTPIRNPRAKSALFDRGRFFLSASIGAGNIQQFILHHGTLAPTIYKSYGPVCVRAEYALTEYNGIGVSFNYVGASLSYAADNTSAISYSRITYTNGVAWNAYSVLVRYNHHFGTDLDGAHVLDPYIGFGLGYRWCTVDQRHNSNFVESRLTFPNFPVGIEGTLGLRYMPIPYLGIQGEIGFGKALAQIGVVVGI